MDKRTTTAAVVAELRDGMTIGIGGWGSRRKPMSIVREILRSPLKDLTIVAYGGPEVGLFCKTGKASKVVYGFVSLDSIPLEPHFRQARQTGAIEAVEYDEGMFQWGLYAAALRLPFLPTRAGLGSDVMKVIPELRTVKSPYADGEELVAVPAIELDVALIHMNRADVHGNGQFLGPDPFFDDLFCMAAKRRFMSCEQIVDTEDLLKEGGPLTCKINRMMVDGVIESPGGAHFTECPPDYGRDEKFQKGVRGHGEGPRCVGGLRAEVPRVFERGGISGSREEPRMSDATRAEICAVAIAETFAGDGEILISPIGNLPQIGGKLARLTCCPDALFTDGVAHLVANVTPHGGGDGPAPVFEGMMNYRFVFDTLWWGRRHVMMGATQIDRYGNQNIACIGDHKAPKAQLLGMRGAPGNTINHTTSYWVPNHSAKVFVPQVDVVSGVGYDRARELGPQASRFHEIRRVVSNLGVFDFETDDNRMRVRSVHPWSSVDEVVEQTGFELVVPDDVPQSRLPTADELSMLRERIDPNGMGSREVPEG